jgi:hypothetical protein
MKPTDTTTPAPDDSTAPPVLRGDVGPGVDQGRVDGAPDELPAPPPFQFDTPGAGFNQGAFAAPELASAPAPVGEEPGGFGDVDDPSVGGTLGDAEVPGSGTFRLDTGPGLDQGRLA